MQGKRRRWDTRQVANMREGCGYSPIQGKNSAEGNSPAQGPLRTGTKKKRRPDWDMEVAELVTNYIWMRW
jgi:hypothetical protein